MRDRVLAGAGIWVGDRVLDVGCGDELIGFGAADLVGPGGVVVFSDISAKLVAGPCLYLQRHAGILIAGRSMSLQFVISRF